VKVSAIKVKESMRVCHTTNNKHDNWT